ncbi:MAG: hypothetical protein R3246_00635 [Acidimicrobiia bacterium]|nr:hypothetical protein [Acidimicrobiia bacterium]
MFYRVTTYEFPPERAGDIAAWVDTKTQEVRGIEGVIAVDVFNAAPGVGVIVASYENADRYEAASSRIATILGELAQFLTGVPKTMSGVPFWTTRVDEPAAI